MNILSITTSSPICGVAILKNNKLEKEINLDNGLTHSESLMSTIDTILKETNMTLTDIDVIACDIGPGSFTGIRIGISTIKAFRDCLNIKAIGVNSLEGLCYNVKQNGVICSIIDAKKDNVYVEIFENIDGNYTVRRNPSFENIDSFLNELKNLNAEYNITFVGDGAITYKDKIISALPNSLFVLENSLFAKSFAYAIYSKLNNLRDENLEPLYLRKSQAEQLLEEKQNGTK